MNNTTAIIVSYNTKSLLQACYHSIRRFYPDMPVIIIDGSTMSDPCYSYAKSLHEGSTKVESMGYNIGHGKGMAHALDLCRTEYALLVDSDTVLLQPKLESLLMYLMDKPDAYGAGRVQQVNKGGFNVPQGTAYLHPYFSLVRMQMYTKFPPYHHHGSPCLNAMKEIERQGKSHLLLPYPVENFVYHQSRGTRALKPTEFLVNWE